MDCRVQPGNDDRWLVAAIYCADSRTAMSVPLNILRHVQRSLNGTQLCKDMLVVTPTEHILRGFLFERTTEKGMYYLWRVVMPLYRPANTVILNYSSRIPNGEKLPLSREGFEEACDRFLKIVLDGHLTYLRDLRRPKDFLEHIAGMVGNTTPVFRLDLALTHYMLGNVRECVKILEELASPQESPASMSSMATALLGDLRTSPASAAGRVEAWERANFENLGLAETVVGIVH
jgi:hypothetical protein